MQETFDHKDYWRAIILYGINQTTYKIALGKALITFVEQDKTHVTMNELAREFFDLYQERIQHNKPQNAAPNRMTVVERILQLYNLERISKEEAITRIEREAFGDVVPRFHNLTRYDLPIQFYSQADNGIFLTDEVFEVFTEETNKKLIEETTSRWDLLEAAFTIKRENLDLHNDKREIYFSKGYERTNITNTIPVLNGYQDGVCFYCGEEMGEGEIHVDHVIPRQVVYHDDIWNLVLAHGFCNTQKSDFLPDQSYINKLIDRNEYFIMSNHPIKHKLIAQLGKTYNVRRKFTLKVFEDAKAILGSRYTWEGIRGYNPSTDKFYRSFVKSLNR